MKCKYGTILKDKRKYSEKNVPYHKSHMDWHRIEPEPLRTYYPEVCSM